MLEKIRNYFFSFKIIEFKKKLINESAIAIITSHSGLALGAPKFHATTQKTHKVYAL